MPHDSDCRCLSQEEIDTIYPPALERPDVPGRMVEVWGEYHEANERWSAFDIGVFIIIALCCITLALIAGTVITEIWNGYILDRIMEPEPLGLSRAFGAEMPR